MAKQEGPQGTNIKTETTKKESPVGHGNSIGQFKGVSGETKVLKLDAMKPNIRTLKSKKFFEAGEIRVSYLEKERWC